ncbi:UNVERIFIED_ORG: iron complex transport system ATP-binding protein [Methylobacterium sp. SuP10 SLI 274]|nr:iron complex transport system ATP-binding protein [Methylobacterium sp. SuP10 SLI 274]
MSLCAHAVDLTIDGRALLSGVGLALEPGRLVGLVGPNGAGKTTLLRVLAGLLPPVKGGVTLDGVPLDRLSREARARRIAALFQGAGVGWPMRVREIVALGRLPHRRAFAGLSDADAAAIARAMAATGITDLAERFEPTLSSGERMRVLLARALAVEAAWLLADEPITALDPAHQLDAMALLRDIARGGTGVVAGAARSHAGRSLLRPDRGDGGRAHRRRRAARGRAHRCASGRDLRCHGLARTGSRRHALHPALGPRDSQGDN